MFNFHNNPEGVQSGEGDGDGYGGAEAENCTWTTIKFKKWKNVIQKKECDISFIQQPS